MLPCFCCTGPSSLHWPLCSCGAGPSPCDGFSHGGAEALGHAGSVVVAQGLCFSSACGVFPDQGSNPCLLHWWVDSYPPSRQGSPDAKCFESIDPRSQTEGTHLSPGLQPWRFFFCFSGRLNDFSGEPQSLNHWVRSSHRLHLPFPPAGDAETPEGIMSS